MRAQCLDANPGRKFEGVLGFHLERLILILRQQTSQNNKATLVDFGVVSDNKVLFRNPRFYAALETTLLGRRQ